MVSASTRISKAGLCTQSNSAKRSAFTKTRSRTTGASPPSSSAQYVWSSTLESTRRDGRAIKSWTSSVSPVLSTSPRSSPRLIAISHGPRKPSVISSASSRSVNSANAPEKNWAPSLTSAASTTKCSTVEPFPSISLRPARTNGSHNKHQSDGELTRKVPDSRSFVGFERTGWHQNNEHSHDFPVVGGCYGQGAPAACHALTFEANSSCGMGTGVRPSPGFHPHITNLSSVRCSTSCSMFRFLFCLGSLIDWQICESVKPCQTIGALAGGKPQFGAPGGRCAPTRLWSQ